MSTFAYVAFDSKGKLFRGNIREKSWTQALRRVKEMGLFPTSVKEQSHQAVREKVKSAARLARPLDHSRPQPWLIGRIPNKAITAFTRQLATLIEAGIPIVKGLRAIEQQEENRALRAILRQVITDIEGGAAFSEALAKHPRAFSRLYTKMVVAGEVAGMLESTLARLADFMERTHKIRSKIKASLFYPVSVIVVATAIVMVLTVVVIPRFKVAFEGLTGSRTLPAFTELVLGISQFIRGHVISLLAGFAVMVVGFILINSTKPGRAVIDPIKLKLPVLGRIIRKATIARFARTLGTMLENGVPVLQALTIARDTMPNVVFAKAVQAVHDRVQDGDSICAPLQTSGVFPATVISMIDVGEQTGALPAMLLKVADNYDDEVDNSITAALSLLEPALIIFLAVVVGSIVIALFLPIIGVIPGSPGNGPTTE